MFMRVPSLGSATAKEAFFSSLIDSNRFDSRGVTFPSTNAAVCSNAVTISMQKTLDETEKPALTCSSAIEFVKILQFQTVESTCLISPQAQWL